MKALVAANRRGYEARQQGLPREACPYQDKRTMMNRVTFSRAFRKAWLDGYDQREREETT